MKKKTNWLQCSWKLSVILKLTNIFWFHPSKQRWSRWCERKKKYITNPTNNRKWHHTPYLRCISSVWFHRFLKSMLCYCPSRWADDISRNENTLGLELGHAGHPPTALASLGDWRKKKQNKKNLSSLLSAFFSSFFCAWSRESRTHVLGAVSASAALCVCASVCVSRCYPCLMHIHNGLKIAQTLCNQILLSFRADWHFWGTNRHCARYGAV